MSHVANKPAPVVRAQDVWFSYPGSQFTLRGVSLEVGAGELCMVLGPSGSGKSTLLKVIKGLLNPQKGTITVFDVPTSNGSSRQSRQSRSRVAYIPQNLGLVRNLTALENTLTGALARTATLPSLFKAFPAALLDEAMELLVNLGIDSRAGAVVHNLSGGERQRVAIARALMQHPGLILADEFVSQLDPVTTREIMAIVKDIAGDGVTFLITSHEIELVSSFGDHAVFFREGAKIHECLAQEVDLAAVSRLMGKT